MPSSTRRAFLSQTLSATAALGLITSTRRAGAIPPIGRTRPSHLKLSVAAYSYRQYLTSKPPTMDLFGFVDLAADMGLDAVEPTSYYFPANVDEAYLGRLKLHAFKLGLDISGTAVGNNFCKPPGADREKEIAHVRRWIDLAAALDAPVIRVFAGTAPKGVETERAAAWAVESMNAVLPHAAEKGVMLALENHGGITTRPEQLLALVKAIDSPFFGVNLDTGNFRGADPYAEMAALAPYAVNVQVKTEITRLGHPKEDADLSREIEILRAAQYSGYVVLEYEAKEDPMIAIPRHVKTLRELLSASGTAKSAAAP